MSLRTTINTQINALKQRVTQLTITNSTLHNSSERIYTQAQLMQHHLDEITRHRTRLTLTNQALEDCQMQLNHLVTQLQTTLERLSKQQAYLCRTP